MRAATFSAFDGCEMCDSVAYNPHKMLGAPLQASLFITKHREILYQTNCAASTYLFQQDKFYDVTAGNNITFKQINISFEILVATVQLDFDSSEI